MTFPEVVASQPDAALIRWTTSRFSFFYFFVHLFLTRCVFCSVTESQSLIKAEHAAKWVIDLGLSNEGRCYHNSGLNLCTLLILSVY